MKDNVIIWLVVLIILVIVGFLLYSRSASAGAQANTPANPAKGPAVPDANITLPAPTLEPTGNIGQNNIHLTIPITNNGPFTMTELPILQGTIKKVSLNTNFVISIAPPPSKYKVPGSGPLAPSINDWFTAMKTQQGFNTWIAKIVPYKVAPMLNIGSSTSGKWYVIDNTHYIRVAFDTHGWVFQFMLITQPASGPYSLSKGFSEPYIAPPVGSRTSSNNGPPDPTTGAVTWWGSYDGGPTNGPSTTYGTALF